MTLVSDLADASGAPRPTHDRSAITTGIVHFGLGNFHRAHQAMFVDRLMERGEAFEWGICEVGVMPSDARMRDVVREQDGLYTLADRPPRHTPTRTARRHPARVSACGVTCMDGVSGKRRAAGLHTRQPPVLRLDAVCLSRRLRLMHQDVLPRA